MLDMWKAKRKEARVSLTLPVVIEGVDESGAAFRDEAVTENVSKQGACVVVERTLKLGTTVTVTAFQNKFKCKAEVRAIWIDESDRSRKKIGVRFIEPTVNWVVG